MQSYILNRKRFVYLYSHADREIFVLVQNVLALHERRPLDRDTARAERPPRVAQRMMLRSPHLFFAKNWNASQDRQRHACVWIDITSDELRYLSSGETASRSPCGRRQVPAGCPRCSQLGTVVSVVQVRARISVKRWHFSLELFRSVAFMSSPVERN